METKNPFTVRGGATGGDPKQFYVERDTDERVFTFLSKGWHCYLFAPKQSGKSSLAVHLQRRLRDGQRNHCVYLNLSVLFNIDNERNDKQKANDICRKFAEGLGAELGISLQDRIGTQWPEEDGVDPTGFLVQSVTEQLIPAGAKKSYSFPRRVGHHRCAASHGPGGTGLGLCRTYDNVSRWRKISHNLLPAGLAAAGISGEMERAAAGPVGERAAG
uniref:AAA-like domain n=1 Tax=Candidatus Kentrum sp. LPFa TaxID=2126335 RepID=A0A450W7E7_9GAMM|nr:MAG: AAA-like domain [Candidatus Kentron sp. LPFa]VFK30596.1 MAG: AAA-like domain [Candidatus Kentron sp. LPFa]